MTEPKAIVADPASDGSEESWILLDEMDEAMNEDYESSQNNSTEEKGDQSTSTETWNEPNFGEVAKGVITTTEENTDHSNVEAISSEGIDVCPSNDEDDDDSDDTAHLRSLIDKRSLQAYDDFNDGSTTDGSISILGDHEINQDRFESEELSSHTPSPQPLQMWMRCTPVDMTICVKRPLEARPLEPNRCQQATLIEESGLPPQNIVEDILNYLERLNSFLSSIYLLQVLLLFLTAGSVALLAIIYARYSACKLEAKDLEQQLYHAKMDKYELRQNLSTCEYLYEMRVGKTVDSDFNPISDNGDKTMPTAQSKPSCQTVDLTGECLIQPTRLSADEIVPLKTSDAVWTGEGEELLSTPKPLKSKDTYISECDDENSLFSEYNREYCENQKNRAHDQKYQNEKIYSTHYSYRAIDDKTCNPNKIDFNLGIEHAKKILRESNCDDEGTMKYLQKAYDHFLAKSRNEAAKGHNKENKKLEKNGKWEKTQKFNNSAIKLGKSEDNSSETHFDRYEKQERKKHHKEKDSDKENKRKNERNDARKYHPDAEYGKWNKNDRKRDTVKVHDHRHDD